MGDTRYKNVADGIAALTYPASEAASGAPSIASGQLTTGAAAALLVAARATRRSVSILNADETNSIAIGGVGVTTATGHIIPPLGSISIDSTAAIYAIALAATPLVTYLESYD